MQLFEHLRHMYFFFHVLYNSTCLAVEEDGMEYSSLRGGSNHAGIDPSGVRARHDVHAYS